MRAIFVLPLLISSAFAGELTKDDSKWLAECIRRLESKSANVAAGAEQAIAVYGADAMPVLVRLSWKL